ncbi:MAG TPA: hypothetical protein VNT75_28120 [Symbiobacteriaceae bacterium]|nr:hypothetical protein [Symbiobacteriaceae bacterium]
MSPQKLRVYARSMRNLFLMFGFAAGLIGLLSSPVILAMLALAPDFIRPYISRYPALAIFLAIGLAVGLVAAYRYRREYPHNPRGANVLTLVTVGSFVIIGAGFAFLGGIGGGVAAVFCAAGAGSYVYLERNATE